MWNSLAFYCALYRPINSFSMAIPSTSIQCNEIHFNSKIHWKIVFWITCCKMIRWISAFGLNRILHVNNNIGCLSTPKAKLPMLIDLCTFCKAIRYLSMDCWKLRKRRIYAVIFSSFVYIYMDMEFILALLRIYAHTRNKCPKISNRSLGCRLLLAVI